ncbi:hypothetical protein BHU72_01740 [Desulfuribacillus stibiiarsenatis]|uniref:HTH marR-type domain-containing protein n=1 Tax=Desulfuribacillus stibiiarsenatis TaxID=1390249 RepID=A0A1E5LA60_9FIRM|nr:MarR family transcriptional regulator [Desulfuribacillus stibiiarsenatis]OEH87002.1 hypothetical protein BHU72_01740 [Desulfuribacillus stibiiarsenatis]
MKTNNIISLISNARAVANTFLKQELKKHGLQELVPAHGSILFALINAEQMTMKDLASAIRRDKSTLTALVTKLEKLGYVLRFTSYDDHRVSFVKLTDKGRELKESFEAISKSLIETGLKDLSPTEKETIAIILTKIIQNYD